MSDVKKENLNVYDDKAIYYLKNSFDCIVMVTKPILMGRLGFLWVADKERLTDGDGNRAGMWRKKLPAEEGFEQSTEKAWKDFENARLAGEGMPSLGEAPAPAAKSSTVKLGPDATKAQKDEDNKARIKAEADAKAKAEAEAAEKARAEAEANAKK